MTTSSLYKLSPSARQAVITDVAPQERDRILHDTIARRAFQICENRRCGPGHQVEHWSRAESELLLPLNCGLLLSDVKIELTTDASPYDGNEIAICAQPRRLMIYGIERSTKLSGNAMSTALTVAEPRLIFRFVDLPIEIEPSQVSARLKYPVLEITLLKAKPASEIRTEKRKAA